MDCQVLEIRDLSARTIGQPAYGDAMIPVSTEFEPEIDQPEDQRPRIIGRVNFLRVAGELETVSPWRHIKGLRERLRFGISLQLFCEERTFDADMTF